VPAGCSPHAFLLCTSAEATAEECALRLRSPVRMPPAGGYRSNNAGKLAGKDTSD